MFDTDGFQEDFPTNSDQSKADLIRAFRGVNNVLTNDVYWHVQSGEVYQYKGVNKLNQTPDLAFTKLTRDAGSVTGGFISPDNIIVGSEDDRVEFSSKGIKIISGGKVRVILGDLNH